MKRLTNVLISILLRYSRVIWAAITLWGIIVAGLGSWWLLSTLHATKEYHERIINTAETHVRQIVDDEIEKKTASTTQKDPPEDGWGEEIAPLIEVID